MASAECGAQKGDPAGFVKGKKKRNQTSWIVSLVGNGQKGESKYGAMGREERTRGVAEDDWRWKSLSWLLIKHWLFIEC